MSNFLFQVTINYKRIVLRNLRFLLFSVVMPISFYILFTQLMNGSIPSSALKTWNVTYLISMIVYSSLIGSIFTVSNTLLEDHNRKFDLFITLSPISKSRYYLSMIVVFLSLNVLSALALEVTALVVNHITVSWFYLIFLLLATPVVSFPLLLLGIMISLIGTGNVVNLLSNLIVFPMAILSGLWWPLNMMPIWMQHIGRWLPAYRAAAFLRDLVQHQHFNLSNFGVLLLWGIFFAGMLKVLTIFMSKKEVSMG